MQIAAIRMGDAWTVAHPNGRAGRFESAPDALQAAARLARDARSRGHDVRLLVHDTHGELLHVPASDPRLTEA